MLAMLTSFSLSAFSPLIFPLCLCFPPCEPLTPPSPPTTLSLSLCIYIFWDQPWLGRLKWTAVQNTRSLLLLCLIPDLETERERILKGYREDKSVALLRCVLGDKPSTSELNLTNVSVRRHLRFIIIIMLVLNSQVKDEYNVLNLKQKISWKKYFIRQFIHELPN